MIKMFMAVAPQVHNAFHIVLGLAFPMMACLATTVDVNVLSMSSCDFFPPVWREFFATSVSASLRRALPPYLSVPPPGFRNFHYALCLFMASPISANDAVDGNTGSKYTCAVPGVIRPRFGQ